MRLTAALLATTLLMGASQQSLAAVQLNVVQNYADAAKAAVWKDVKVDSVPQALIQNVQVADPHSPYAGLFPKAFFQEEAFFVCYQDCKQADANSNKDALEQQTVYFWLSKFYQMAKERFDLTPTGRVRVLVNRDIKDPGTSKKMRNNAFFNPADGSLTFLPASANPLAALMGAAKLNRSGFDPSVIAHEAGHSLFHSLFPHAVNPEIDGFNEGFADYMANILMEQAQVGLVMLRGEALRDSSSFTDSSGQMKTYAPGLEAHDMGERFATALWKSRQEVSDALEFDRLVIDGITDAARNPFATGHSIKDAILKRVEHTYEAELSRKIHAIWEMFVAGTDHTITDTSFLGEPIRAQEAWGLRVQNKYPTSVTRDLGITNSVSRFTHIKSVKTAEGYAAHLVATSDGTVMKPYWIVIDPSRGNALGGWRLDGSEIEAEDAEIVAGLVTQILTLNETVGNFLNQATMFTQLAEGRGDLTSAYKVSKHDKKIEATEYNGETVYATAHTLTLKRKLLARIVFGVPPVKTVKIITLKKGKFADQWPTLEGGTVIGVALELEDGTLTETIFEQVRL